MLVEHAYLCMLCAGLGGEVGLKIGRAVVGLSLCSWVLGSKGKSEQTNRRRELKMDQTRRARESWRDRHHPLVAVFHLVRSIHTLVILKQNTTLALLPLME